MYSRNSFLQELCIILQEFLPSGFVNSDKDRGREGIDTGVWGHNFQIDRYITHPY
jgi:hypothetical protein